MRQKQQKRKPSKKQKNNSSIIHNHHIFIELEDLVVVLFGYMTPAVT